MWVHSVIYGSCNLYSHERSPSLNICGGSINLSLFKDGQLDSGESDPFPRASLQKNIEMTPVIYIQPLNFSPYFKVMTSYFNKRFRLFIVKEAQK